MDQGRNCLGTAVGRHERGPMHTLAVVISALTEKRCGFKPGAPLADASTGYADGETEPVRPTLFPRQPHRAGYHI